MMNSAVLYIVLFLTAAAAVLTVLTDRLLSAVIFAGALSAEAALCYLMLGAPDVALAEIVVGATLATVIFLVTLKKYRMFTGHPAGEPGAAEPDGEAESCPRARGIAFVFILLVGAGLFGGYALMGEPGPSPLFDAVFARGFFETAAENLVTAVYLNYRLFDTMLEALLLLVSVIGVSQFARLSGSERANLSMAPRDSSSRESISHVMTGSLRPVYLLIALVGVYTIVTGMDGPGGGFQGGAILAAIVISAHSAEGRQLLSLKTGERLEETMYALILGIGMLFLVSSERWSWEQHRLYLLIINILIGLKVFSGLSMVYLHFMAGEGEENA